MNAFERLSPFIQDFIYRKGWQELRPIQLAACEAIFHSKEHLLLSSGTASGKTEAAFLPVLTLLGEDPPRSVGILYVSPLKALINDQFVRLAPLLEEGKIPVCKWHGDASRGGKQRVLRSPAGVVQITPESLESLLRRPKDCQRLFCDLRFIIIDEVHHFMANERGMQLQCLLERLERLACCQPRRIGLSATVGDATQAKAWLCAGSARGCIHPKAPDARRRLQIWMEYFEREEEPDFDDRAALLPREDGKLAQFLFAQTLGKKSIIFTNSRMEAEGTIAGLKRIAQERKAPNVYRVHHGSISAALREEAEREMKQGNRPFVTAATLTLELGLDIGDLDRVLQMGAPVSVSSLVQRIGRCGRQGQVAQLLFAFQEDAAELPEDPLNSFHWGMIKAIAMLELYLGERWIEPTTENRFPFGILYHQTMSVLLANGGVLSPKRLAQEVLTLHAFRYITREDFQCLLRHLIEIGHLQRGETGELMIGLEAEPIITGHDFLSVFTTSQEYPVRYNGKEIGILNAALQPGERIVLAGKSWECIACDNRRKEISVIPFKGTATTHWEGMLNTNLHTRLVERMREVLREEREYPYLSENCLIRLREMRRMACEMGITEEWIVQQGTTGLYLFPWMGTTKLRTLQLALRTLGVNASIAPSGFAPIYLDLEHFFGGRYGLQRILSRLEAEEIDLDALPVKAAQRSMCKFDSALPAELLEKQLRSEMLAPLTKEDWGME